MNYERMNTQRQVSDPHKRVGAYCRVSTDKRDQENSFESQQRFFRDYIERRPDWELVEVYADEGRSGTTTKKRKQFNRMIQDAKARKLDLIITKEVSRFARNTVDSLQITRDLKAIGVGVIYLNDNINSLDPDAELRLTIMSSIAQEESRKTSERVKWGQTRRMEQGVVFGRDMLGYDVNNGVLTINEEGARIVRKIFDMYVNEDLNVHTICDRLREMGIKPMRIETWSDTVVGRVLRNEKYCGDLVQKKTFTPDYLSHAKRYNRGQEEFIIIRNHHEPIVSRELFDAAQRRIAAHRPQKNSLGNSNRTCFSGKIICGRCGASYVTRYRDLKDGGRSKYWVCGEAHAHGKRKEHANGEVTGCSWEAIRNIDAIHIMQMVFERLAEELDSEGKRICQDVQTVLGADKLKEGCVGTEQEIQAIQSKKEKLLQLYLNDGLAKEDYLNANNKLNQQIAALKSVQARGIGTKFGKEQEIGIAESIKAIASSEEFNDSFYRRALDHMVVHDRNHVDVYLKALPSPLRFEVDPFKGNQANEQASGDIAREGTDQPISVNVAFTRSSGME